MGNMETTKSRISFSDIILFLIFLALIAIPGYLCYQIFFVNNKPEQQEEVKEETPKTEVIEEEEEIPDGPHYEEKIFAISGQIAYIAIPTNIDENDPPRIVIYNHGSNTRVTENLEDPFMKDLQIYGEEYTKSNLIFAASNAHDENWGNAASIQDNFNMVEWIRNNYSTSRETFVIGFSMGGLPAMHYVAKYPKDISKVALLAPTTRSYEWNKSNIDVLDGIDIQIWHGTKDVNIGITNSRSFVNSMDKLGKKITLIELDGKTHFDLDTEYRDEVLDFFLN